MPQITLKAARVNAGLNIMEASKKLGISHGTLVKWEKHPDLLTTRQQLVIEEVYGMSIDHIFFGK